MEILKKYVFKNTQDLNHAMDNMPDVEYDIFPLPPTAELKGCLGCDDFGDPEEIIMNEELCVDVLWYDLTESPEHWKPFEIEPADPWNKVAGLE